MVAATMDFNEIFQNSFSRNYYSSWSTRKQNTHPYLFSLGKNPTSQTWKNSGLGFDGYLVLGAEFGDFNLAG